MPDVAAHRLETSKVVEHRESIRVRRCTKPEPARLALAGFSRPRRAVRDLSKVPEIRAKCASSDFLIFASPAMIAQGRKFKLTHYPAGAEIDRREGRGRESI
jgi:hypothetical protein